MLAIYLIILVFLLILFVLLTAIGLTFKLKVLSIEERKELRGIFTVKWLFFSRTFSIKKPEEKTCLFNEPGTAENEASKGTIIEAGTPGGEKRSAPGEEKPGEQTLTIEGEEKIVIKEQTESKEKTQVKKKRGIFDRIRGKKRVSEESEVEAKKGMTTREKLHWGLKAYEDLRKPLFRLITDILNAIKIKNLKADLTFGLPDPADTGMLCGFIHAFLGTVYSRCRSCSFSVCPVFMESLLDFRGSAEIRVKIYSLIFPIIKFILNGKTLSFTYSIVKEKLRGSSKINS